MINTCITASKYVGLRIRLVHTVTGISINISIRIVSVNRRNIIISISIKAASHCDISISISINISIRIVSVNRRNINISISIRNWKCEGYSRR